MHTNTDTPSSAEAVTPPRARAKRTSFRREIVLALMLKLALLAGIKVVFFSHPVSKQEAAARLSTLITGDQGVPARPLPSTYTDRSEQK